jgi:hypothetical protein
MRILLVFLMLQLACTAENATPTAPAPVPTFDPTNATLLKSGNLEGIGHTVSGTASLYESEGIVYVLLDPFSSQNGPDLKVYLSTDVNASNYISLGKLKSTAGTQAYPVPGMPAVANYTYVHIWCEQFSVVFGRAAIN